MEGYAHTNADGTYSASPTCTLVESNNTRFLVDPGTNSKMLFEALSKNDLKTGDISFIYLSHYHPDHWLNARLFPDTDIYDGEICWQDETEMFHQGKLPGVEGIEIIKTPGHADEDTSLLIKTEEGFVAICPDVFWWEDGKQKTDLVEDLLNLEDPFANNREKLLESRKLILSKTDFVIPGHGKIFKVNK